MEVYSRETTYRVKAVTALGHSGGGKKGANMYLRAVLALGTFLLSFSTAMAAESVAAPGPAPSHLSVCGTEVNATFTPVPAGTPTKIASFWGQWGDGRQAWGGNLCSALFVTNIDSAGKVSAIYVTGAYPAWGILRAEAVPVSGQIGGDTLTIRLPSGNSVTYTTAGKFLDGSYVSTRGYPVAITLPHLPPK